MNNNNRDRNAGSLFVLILALLSLSGCLSTSDPLTGWMPDGDSGFVDMNGTCQAYVKQIPYGKAVSDDVQTFIDTLPVRKGSFADRSESYWIYKISLSKDGMGQHAVQIYLNLNGDYLSYVLIYDGNNVRTKVIKYKSGTYRS
jgi:hypothetical protein